MRQNTGFGGLFPKCAGKSFSLVGKTGNIFEAEVLSNYDEGREQIPFPWEKLTGKPLIYASLGTLVNGLDRVYEIILKTVGKLPEIQVVLSAGKNVEPEDLGSVPSNTILVRSAPQIELLKRATLCITHAGLNTTLEALGPGVPMVAIPIGYDQPGVAARIPHHGTGEFIELDELTTNRLRGSIEKVLQGPSYRERADYFRRVISKTRGLDVAADIIEQAFLTRADVAHVNAK